MPSRADGLYVAQPREKVRAKRIAVAALSLVAVGASQQTYAGWINAATGQPARLTRVVRAQMLIFPIQLV
jgi:hypothetical protein